MGNDKEAKAAMEEKVEKENVAQAISIKPPTFSDTSPALWFRIMEAQFNIKGIKTPQTKFYHVLASLPTEILENIPPTVLDGEDYEEMKTAIISFYEQTKPELFAKLISTTAMTGRPSMYLRQLQQLATKVHAGDDLVRHQFIKSLPPTIAPVIAAQPSLSLMQLGSIADELMPLHLQIHNVNNATSETQHQLHQRSRRQSPNQSTSGNIGIRPFYPDQRPRICRGHIFYADKSRTCKPWCKYPNKRGCSIQPSSRPPSRANSPAPSKESENQ